MISSALYRLRSIFAQREFQIVATAYLEKGVSHNHRSYHLCCKRKNNFRPFNNSSTFGRILIGRRYIVTQVANMSASGIVFDFSMPFASPDELVEQAVELIERCRAIYDRAGALPPQELTKENFLQVLVNLERIFTTQESYLDFPKSVSADNGVRNASTDASKMMEKFNVEICMHQGIFNNLLAFKNKNLQLTSEENRFLERLIKLGKRNGLHLSSDVQEKVKAIKNRMSELSIQFNKNANEEISVLEFSENELDGLTPDFINNLAKNESGKRKVTLKYPHYFPIMRKARNPLTRKKLDDAFNRQCIEDNTKILEELVTLRHQLANLLGFPTHAAYITDMRMSKTSETVCKFLNELADKLKDVWQKEKSILLDFKKKECLDLGLEFNGEIENCDTRYYTTMVEEKLFAVDQEKLREYFPLPVVTDGLLQIYQELLSLTFQEIHNPKVWHKDVQMFSVSDAKSGKLMGYFFLDLYPREGKYGHAAIFPLQPSSLLEDGTRQLAVAAMVANFTKPTADKPSLLDHHEVVTFFHEFGHLMHHICSEADVAHFSGTRVERDFVEAPSQMLENWCWEAESLRRMSAHYSDGSPLHEDVLGSLVRSRLANVAYTNIRQIVLGLFDHTIHTSPTADTAKVFAEISDKLSGIKPTPGTNFAAHFLHLAGGYDAQYYGYMWSEVYSMDMFASKFKKDGVMNPATGMEYRQKILVPGGSKDAWDMLVDFLGREPNDEAFLISKGLKAA